MRDRWTLDKSDNAQVAEFVAIGIAKVLSFLRIGISNVKIYIWH